MTYDFRTALAVNSRVLQDAVDAWQADGKWRGFTPAALALRGQRVGALVQFVASTGVQDWPEMTPGHLVDWVDHLALGVRSRWTLNGYIQAARAFLHWYERMIAPLSGLEGRPIPDVLPKVRAAVDTVHPLTKEEIRRLLKAPDPKEWVEWRDLTLLKLFLDTGLRAREGLWLQLEDLIWDRHLLRIRSSSAKGGRERYVPMSVAVEGDLRRWVSKRFGGEAVDCPWVFPRAVLWRTEPRPLTPHSWRARFAHYARRAGLPTDAHPHSLRHTFAVQYLAAGGDVFSLQAILGHASLATTRRYVNPAALEDLVLKARERSVVAGALADGGRK